MATMKKRLGAVVPSFILVALVVFLFFVPAGVNCEENNAAPIPNENNNNNNNDDSALGKQHQKQFVPADNSGTDVHMYYGSFGGASNCENCLVKARWLAEKLRVDTLHVPACKRKPGDENMYPTMNPLEYFDRDSLQSCNLVPTSDSNGESFVEQRSLRTFNVESLGRSITADVVNGMPCFELVEGWCEIERHRLGEYLIPKHKYKVEWKVVTSNIAEAREYGNEIYFAGMYDFEPVNPRTGATYPNLWQREAQRYVKGEVEQLGWADEAVEKRRRERDAVRAKKAAEAKNGNKKGRDNKTGETPLERAKQQSIPRKDMFLAREQQIKQQKLEDKQKQLQLGSAGVPQQLQPQHQISEETIRQAWNENANSNAGRRRRARNLLSFSSIEPCYSNGNLNDEIYEEANKEIDKLKIEPSDTLCVHWRQEDFLWKKIGNEFVKNISYAAERIINRAEVMQLSTVLLLTNDPEMYPDDKRYDGRVAVNTLRGMLHQIGGLRVEWSMHRSEMDKSKAIYIDKATCSMMEDFIGTGKSSFTATIMDIRHTHELCSMEDPNAQLGRNSKENDKSRDATALMEGEGSSLSSPAVKYKMCLKEKYGGVKRESSDNHGSPFIFPIDEIEHPIHAIESLLTHDGTVPATSDDVDDDSEHEIDLKGGPEVVDEYLTEEEIQEFKSKEKKIEPKVEKMDHDDYVQEYQEENQQTNALKEFSILDPSISAEDLKLDLRELDDDASAECDRCYAAMPQSEVATPNAEIWLTTPSCEKCGVQLLKVQKKRANANAKRGSEK